VVEPTSHSQVTARLQQRLPQLLLLLLLLTSLPQHHQQQLVQQQSPKPCADGSPVCGGMLRMPQLSCSRVWVATVEVDA
jgi:hypothetical protein